MRWIDAVTEWALRRMLGVDEETQDWMTPPDPARFPFEILDVPGDRACAEWQRLSQTEGTPIILGTREDDLGALAFPFDPGKAIEEPDISTVLAEADQIDFPAEMKRIVERRIEADREYEETPGDTDAYYEEVLNGAWPDEPVTADRTDEYGPLSVRRLAGDAFHDEVMLTVLPTNDPTEAPAFLAWGDWNSNPRASYHVAAFRSWAERYGAVPVVMTSDVVEFRVSRRPETREEALALAVEMFGYCPDILYQGWGNAPALAANLMVSDWWYFWWD